MECGAPSDVPAAPGASSVQIGAPVSARRVTSVLFGDLVGFTTLSESRDSEETRELLSRYFDECRLVVERYGGTVEKFIGDAVMAVWGVPTAHEDDAERSVRAGLELVNVVTSIGEEVGVPDLAMRVGIVTGEVAVTIGALQQGMVAGDTVNTAARVQSVAAPGQVWVDETTRLLTSAAITYVDAGSHRLKGKADAIPLWSVRAVVAAVGGAQRADGLEAPLVGRERELRVVKELFHSVEETQRPALLVIAGDAGIGKSRLAWEFEKYVDGLTSTTRWHQGRCVAYGEGVAFYALAEAVRGRLRAPYAGLDDVSGDDPAALLDGGLEHYVADDSERAWLRPRLGVLLGLESMGSFDRLDLFSAWVAFLERVGGDGSPVTLVIDEAQHADEGLLSFLEHLVATAAFPCFVLLLTRPELLERRPALLTNPRASLSHLAVLSDDEIGALLDGLVGGLPESARDALITRSAGVPLYAVETVRSLIDRDLVVPRGGQYVLADPDRLDLDSVAAPTSLQALVAARLDALTPEQRLLVDRAAVLGEVFSKEHLERLLAEGDAAAGGVRNLDDLLGELVRLQILTRLSNRLSADFGNYQFVQSVVRQVAYSTLSRRDRKATHLAVARMAERDAEAAGGLSAVIAQHYLDAIEAVPNDPDVADLETTAIAHLERAAERAHELGAPVEAAGHLQAGLELSRDPATRARLQTAAARALVYAGDYPRAIAHADAAVEGLDRLGDTLYAAVAASWHALALWSTGDLTEARELLEPRWRDVADSTGDDRALLQVLKAYSISLPTDSPRGRELLDRRVQLASKLGDDSELIACLSNMSIYYDSHGAAAMARVLTSAAADLARRTHDQMPLVHALVGLAVGLNVEDLPRAIETGRQAVEAAQRGVAAFLRGLAEVNLAIALVAAGDWVAAEELMAAGDDQLLLQRTIGAGLRAQLAWIRGEPAEQPWSSDDRPESEDPNDLAWIGLAEAVVARSHGELEVALQLSVAATERLFGHTGISDDFVHVWPVAVEHARSCGADDTLTRLLALVDDASARMAIPLAVKAHRTRVAGLLAQERDPEQVEPLLRSAIDLFSEWGAVPYRARTEAELGSWLVSRGRPDEGRPLLERGRATLEELGARTWLAETDPAGVLAP